MPPHRIARVHHSRRGCRSADSSRVNRGTSRQEVLRPRVDFSGRAELLDHAALHHGHSRRERHRFVPDRASHRSSSRRAADAVASTPCAIRCAASHRDSTAVRRTGTHRLRARSRGRSRRVAAARPTVARACAEQRPKLQHVGRALDAARNLRLRRAVDAQSKGQIALDAHRRIQRIRLEHERHATILRIAHVIFLAANFDAAAGSRRSVRRCCAAT